MSYPRISFYTLIFFRLKTCLSLSECTFGGDPFAPKLFFENAEAQHGVRRFRPVDAVTPYVTDITAVNKDRPPVTCAVGKKRFIIIRYGFLNAFGFLRQHCFYFRLLRFFKINPDGFFRPVTERYFHLSSFAYSGFSGRLYHSPGAAQHE